MKHFMPDANYNERLQVLQNTAENIREEEYFRDLTPAEVADREHLFTANAKVIGQIEEKKKRLWTLLNCN